MWRLTSEGRRFLKRLAHDCGGRREFGLQVGIGKNQVKPILDNPEHSINCNTKDRLKDFSDDFLEEAHYIGVAVSDGSDIRLARDRAASKTLSRHDQRGIQELYSALAKNPDFRQLRSSLIPLSETRRWFLSWGNFSEDTLSEKFFVYRMFRDKVIAFLYGERLLKTTNTPEVFLVGYLVGPTNAFYDGSPVGLDASDEKALPLGERASSVQLTIRLLEELLEERSVGYLLFEVVAEELQNPDSIGRLLFRVYAHAEEEIKRHFSQSLQLKNSRCYLLDFPYLAPMPNANSVLDITTVEHRLICCPLTPSFAAPFAQGKVPSVQVARLLKAVYQIYCGYYDHDSPVRAAVKAATLQAEAIFQEDFVKQSALIPCFTLRDYIKTRFSLSQNHP